MNIYIYIYKVLDKLFSGKPQRLVFAVASILAASGRRDLAPCISARLKDLAVRSLGAYLLCTYVALTRGISILWFINSVKRFPFSLTTMAMGRLPQSCGSVGVNTPRGLVSGVGCYGHGRITAGPKVAISQSFVRHATKRRFSRHGASRVQATAGGSPDPWATKYPAWDSIQRELTSVYGIKSLSAQEAAALVEAGEAILLDVRLEEAHEEAHPEGAINAPAFRIIKNGDAGGGGGGFSRVLKSLVLRVNGVTPTEVCSHQSQWCLLFI